MPSGNITQYLPLVLMLVAVYFLFVRQPQKQRQSQAQMVESLVPGTQILTIGGIFATVVEVEGDRILVSLADGAQMQVATRAVASVIKADEPELDEAPESETDESESDPSALDASADASSGAPSVAVGSTGDISKDE
jgi:preprotein translocase subunit YajC